MLKGTSTMVAEGGYNGFKYLYLFQTLKTDPVSVDIAPILGKLYPFMFF